MSSIDERIVQMEFDNKAFEKDVKVTMNTLGKLREELKLEEASKGFDEINKAASKVDLSAVTNSVEQLQERFSVFGDFVHDKLYGVLDKIFGMVTSVPGKFFKAIWDMSDLGNLSAGMEKFGLKTTSVQTILSATGLSMEEVNEQLNKLNWFTDETSYNLTDMINNIGKFTNIGIPLDVAATSMIGIANASGLAGAKIQDASHAFEGFSKAMGQGYMSLMNWKWIKTAHLNTKVFQEELIKAGEALGTIQEGEVTVANLETTLKKRWMTADVMNTALATFGERTEEIYEIYQSLGGEFTTSKIIQALGELSGNFDEMGLKAFRAAQEAKTFEEVIDSVKDAVSTKWMQSFELIFGNKVEATEMWTAMANSLWDVFAAAGDTRNEILQLWHDFGGREALIEGVANLFHGFMGVLNRLKDFFPIFQLSYKDFTETIAGKLIDISNVFNNVTSVFRNAFEIKEEAEESLVNYIQQYREIKSIVADILEVGEISDGAAKRLTDLGANLDILSNSLYNVSENGKEYDDSMAMSKDVMADYSEAINELNKANEDTAESIEKPLTEMTKFENVSTAVSAIIVRIKNLITDVIHATGPLVFSVIVVLNQIWQLFGSLAATIAALINVIDRSVSRTDDASIVLQAVYWALVPLEVILKLIALGLSFLTTALDNFRDRINELEGVQQLAGAFGALFNAIFMLGEVIKSVFLGVFAALEGIFGSDEIAAYEATAALDGFAFVLSSIVNIVANAIKAIAGFIGLVGSGLVSAIEYIVEAWNTKDEKGVLYNITHSKAFAVLKVFGDAAKYAAGAVKELIEALTKKVDEGDTTVSLVDRIRSKFREWAGMTEDAEMSGEYFITGLVVGLRKGLKWLWDTVVSVANLIINGITSTLQIESPSKVAIALALFWIAGLVIGMQDGFKDVTATAGEIGKRICNTLSNAFRDFNFEKLGKVIASIAAFNGAKALGGLAGILEGTSDSMEGLAKAIKNFNKGKGVIAKTFKAFQYVAKAYTASISADAIKKFAISIAITTGAFIALIAAIKIFKVETTDLTIATVAVLGFAAAFVLFMKIVNKMMSVVDAAKMAPVALTIMSLGAAISMFTGAAIALALVAKLGLDFQGPFVAIGLMMVSLAGCISMIVQAINKGGIMLRPGNLLAISLVIVALGSVVGTLAAEMALLSILPWQNIAKGLVALGGIMLGLVGVIAATTLVLRSTKRGATNYRNLLSVSLLFVALGAVVGALTACVAVLGNVPNLKGGVEALVFIMGMLTLCVSAVAIVLQMQKRQSITAKQILALGAILLAFSGTIAVMTGMVAVLAVIAQKEGALIKAVGAASVLMLMILAFLAMVEFGTDKIANPMSAVNMLAMSAAILSLGMAIALLVPSLVILGKLPWLTIGKGLLAFAGALAVLVLAGGLATAAAAGLAAISLVLVSIGGSALMVASSVGVLAAGIAALTAALIAIGGSSSLILAGVHVLAQGLIDFCDDVLDGVILLAPKIAAALYAVLKALNHFMIDLNTMWIEGTVYTFVVFLRIISEYAGEIADLIMKCVTDIMNALADRLPDFVDALTKFLNSLADVIRNKSETFNAAIANVFSAIFEVVEDCFKKLDEKFEKYPWYRILKVSLEKGVQGAVDALTPLDEFGEAMRFGEKMMEASEKDQPLAEAAGDNLKQGFINGIVSKIFELTNAVKYIGGESLDKLQETLQEKSPSRATFDMGEFFTEGFKNGIESGSDDAAAAAEGVADNTMSSFSDKITEWLDSALPTVITKTIELGSFMGLGLDIGLVDSKDSVVESAGTVTADAITEMQNSAGIETEGGMSNKTYGISTQGMCVGLATGITTAAPAIVSLFSTFGSDITNSLGQGTGTMDSGSNEIHNSPYTENMSKGVAYGFTTSAAANAWNSVISWIYDAAAKAFGSVKKAENDVLNGSGYNTSSIPSVAAKADALISIEQQKANAMWQASQSEAQAGEYLVQQRKEQFERDKEINKESYELKQKELQQQEDINKKKEQAQLDAEAAEAARRKKQKQEQERREAEMQSNSYSESVRKTAEEAEKREREKELEEERKRKKREREQAKAESFIPDDVLEAAEKEGKRKIPKTWKEIWEWASRELGLGDIMSADEFFAKFLEGGDFADSLTKAFQEAGDAASDAAGAIGGGGGSGKGGGGKNLTKATKDYAALINSLDLWTYIDDATRGVNAIQNTVLQSTLGLDTFMTMNLDHFKKNANTMVWDFIEDIGNAVALEAEFADKSEENGEKEYNIQKKLQEAWEKHYNSIKNAVEGSVSIWKKYEKTAGMSFKTIESNIYDQSQALDKWENGLSELAQRGLNYDVFMDLAKQGVDSLGQVEEMLTWDSAQMKKFNNWCKEFGIKTADAYTEAVWSSIYAKQAKLHETSWEVNKTFMQKNAEYLGITLQEYMDFEEGLRETFKGIYNEFAKFEKVPELTLKQATKNLKSQTKAINEYNSLFNYAANVAQVDPAILKHIMELGFEEGYQLMLGIRHATKSELKKYQEEMLKSLQLPDQQLGDVQDIFEKVLERGNQKLGAGVKNAEITTYKALEKAKAKIKDIKDFTKDAINDVIHSFDAVGEYTKVSATELTKNLMDQTKLVVEWNSDLIELARRGLGRNVLEALRQEGIGSIDVVRGFMDMSLEDIKKYNKEWINQTNKRTDILANLEKELEQLYSDQEKHGDYFYRNLDIQAKNREIKTEKLRRAIKEEYQLMYDSVKETVQSGINLFEYFDTKTDVSAKRILKNMRSQVQGIKQWQANLETLADRGIGQGLLDQLASMGLSGYKYTQTFINMTDEQLREAVSLFGESEKLPDTVAKSVAGSYTMAGKNVAEAFAEGLTGSYSMEKVATFASNAVRALQYAFGIIDETSGYSSVGDNIGKNLGSSTENSIKNEEPKVEATAKEAGEKIVTDGLAEGVQDGTKESTKTTVETVQTFGNNIKNAITDTEMYDRGKMLGMMICQGLSQGIWENTYLPYQQAQAMAAQVGKAAGLTLEVASPSRLFYRIGAYIDEGLANGIYENAGIPADRIEEVSDDVANTMRDAMQVAIATADDIMSTDPVIKPVVDLSDVQSGSAYLQQLLGDGGSYGLKANAMYSIPSGGMKDAQWSEMRSYMEQTMNELHEINKNGLNAPINLYVYGSDGQDIDELADAVMERFDSRFASRRMARA